MIGKARDIGGLVRGWLTSTLNLIGRGPFPPPAPQTLLHVIGDVHGRLDLVDQMLGKLDPTNPVVFVGDYVDRGENSAGVLRRLKALSSDTDFQVHCLMGNHEEMLLNFLDDPKTRGKTWLRNGGLQTLASFGVTGISESSSGNARIDAANRLHAAMGQDLIDWLRDLPVFWQSGNVTVVHAGADPSAAIEGQPVQNLIWGRPDFHSKKRSDGMWVVHGHKIVDAPIVSDGVISIDTGAYATGRLTAAVIEQGQVEFIST